MKRSKLLAAVILVAVCSMMVLTAGTANAQNDVVVGPMSESEYFPDMMQSKSGCQKAYHQFVVLVSDLEACESKAHAEMQLAANQAYADDLKNTRGARQRRNTFRPWRPKAHTANR